MDPSFEFSVVPWGKTRHGLSILTSIHEAELLGFGHHVTGFEETGYTVMNRAQRKIVQFFVEEMIDWDRYVAVKNQFTMPFNVTDREFMLFDDKIIIEERDYQNLCHACYRDVPWDQLDKDILELRDIRRSLEKLYRISVPTRRKKNMIFTVYAVNPRDADNTAWAVLREKGLIEKISGKIKVRKIGGKTCKEEDDADA